VTRREKKGAAEIRRSAAGKKEEENSERISGLEIQVSQGQRKRVGDRKEVGKLLSSQSLKKTKANVCFTPDRRVTCLGERASLRETRKVKDQVKRNF